MLHRRHFLQMLAASAAGSAFSTHARDAAAPQVMTVLGPVSAAELGLTLPHEHITTDFLGAEKLPQPRYERDAAFETILPALKGFKARGGSALFECTPNHIGRDPLLLRRLAKASGVHLITNTGYYGAVGNRFLPRHAYIETAEQLAGRWLAEWRQGIEGTGIKPGFIKLGVENGKLPLLHEKLARAAARAHRESGLTICIHTGNGEAARDELRILREEKIAPEAWVWVHAQNDPGPIQIEVARQGGWVSLDGYSAAPENAARYRKMLNALKGAGCLRRVLLSHDDGWAVEGEAPANSPLKLFGNGNPQPYTSLFTKLLPELREDGFTAEEIDLLTRRNPAEALAVRVRMAG